MPSWIVKALAERVYDANPCGPGRFLDPRTDACVFVCQPGYRYDPATKSCVAVEAASCAEGYVLEDAQCVLDTSCADGFVYDPSTDTCTVAQGSVSERRKRGPWQSAVAWVAKRVLGGGEGESCPVGFYVDPASRACVPLCAPGFLYDPDLKRCIPMYTAAAMRK